MFESSQQVVRRTALLLATTALAVVVAGGIALAATFTCTTNPCVGTPEADQITGTLNPETVNGQAGDDEIFPKMQTTRSTVRMAAIPCTASSVTTISTVAMARISCSAATATTG